MNLKSDKNPLYFDIHSHINFSQFDEDRDEIIREMKNRNIWTITVGTDEKTSKEAVDLADKHENIFATVGIHPTDKEGFDRDYFEELVSNEKVVGVGECGLDYFRIEKDDSSEKDRQRKLFIEQVEFALQKNLPIMIHGRPSPKNMDAYEDMLDILEDFKSDVSLRGDVHFFVGDIEIARKFLDLGFYISFDGPITFTKEYDEVVRFAPLDRICVETDAPFAAPAPYRGKRNNPLYVKEIVERVAEIRDEDINSVKDTLVINALKLWNISV